MEDRRRYFRINDDVMVNYYPLSEQEADARSKEIVSGIIRDVNERQPLLSIETQLKGMIEHLRDTSPQAARAVQMLNQKLDYIMRFVNVPEEQIQALDEQAIINASVSACGIAFDTNDKHIVDQKVILEIVLPPSYTQITAVGTIMMSKAVENHARKYRIAVDFDCISEVDQELLIQHILRKQAEYLKDKRKQSVLS